MVNLRMSRILVSGASGPVGTALLPSLKAGGAQVARLPRSTAGAGGGGEERIPWDPSQPIAPDRVSGFDAVIHLAGESIVGRWTDAKKRRIRESRVKGTLRLAEALVQTAQRPRV